ncbi:phosphatidylinositol phosphatase [Tieghemostelium lacteum]|uniref:Phosphatidylinositol phosphatase n=1 Tax=Tieghemostelium lacteum TaxID=361077 RepID=A0A152A7B3_TIELA|nr:phosphatidylinositol phosphatase [Tieghemostelium lacteum]|eukprot:KYR02118.1 phosphatidylinositol phosphatase [Tieghemostelium lacteum]
MSNTSNLININQTVGGYSLNQYLAVLVPLKLVVTLYLFYKAKLPLIYAKYFGRIFHYMTFPFITILQSAGLRGNLFDAVDDQVYLGAIQMYWNIPGLKMHGIKGVVNLCDEYQGPQKEYKKHDIDQLYVPVIDHYEPSVSEIRQCITFIQDQISLGHKVLVHCKAGRGRSGAVMICYVALTKKLSLIDAQKYLVEKRSKVRKSLYKQKSVIAFYNQYCK